MAEVGHSCCSEMFATHWRTVVRPGIGIPGRFFRDPRPPAVGAREVVSAPVGEGAMTDKSLDRPLTVGSRQGSCSCRRNADAPPHRSGRQRKLAVMRRLNSGGPPRRRSRSLGCRATLGCPCSGDREVQADDTHVRWRGDTRQGGLRHADPRECAIRGQLRFWWRLLNDGRPSSTGVVRCGGRAVGRHLRNRTARQQGDAPGSAAGRSDRTRWSVGSLNPALRVMP